jgi:hypothetical protein
MMILEDGEICPYAANCPHNKNSYGPCYGTIATRGNKFECEFVVNGQFIIDSGFRNPLDQTGKMKIIME